MGHRLHYLSVALEMQSSLRTKHLCIHESVYLFLFYFFSRKSRQSWKIIKSLKDKQRIWSSWKDSQLRVYRFHKHHYYSIFCLPTWDYSELLGEIGLLVVLLGCLDQLLLTNACTHPWNVTFVLFFFFVHLINFVFFGRYNLSNIIIPSKEVRDRISKRLH